MNTPDTAHQRQQQQTRIEFAAANLEPFDTAAVPIHLDLHEVTSRSTQQDTVSRIFAAHGGRLHMQRLTLHRKPPTRPGPLP